MRKILIILFVSISNILNAQFHKAFPVGFYADTSLFEYVTSAATKRFYCIQNWGDSLFIGANGGTLYKYYDDILTSLGAIGTVDEVRELQVYHDSLFIGTYDASTATSDLWVYTNNGSISFVDKGDVGGGYGVYCMDTIRDTLWMAAYETTKDTDLYGYYWGTGINTLKKTVSSNIYAQNMVVCGDTVYFGGGYTSSTWFRKYHNGTITSIDPGTGKQLTYGNVTILDGIIYGITYDNGHFIEYDCSTGVWTDNGQLFSAISGRVGLYSDTIVCSINISSIYYLNFLNGLLKIRREITNIRIDKVIGITYLVGYNATSGRAYVYKLK